jgi:cell division protein FtsL
MMTTATRALSQGKYIGKVDEQPLLHEGMFNLRMTALVLTIAVVLSAFAVVYVKDLNRRLFIQSQGLQMANNKLQVEWGKLLLEQSTWSSQARVQQLAQERLNMKVPSPSEVNLIRI